MSVWFRLRVKHRLCLTFPTCNLRSSTSCRLGDNDLLYGALFSRLASTSSPAGQAYMDGIVNCLSSGIAALRNSGKFRAIYFGSTSSNDLLPISNSNLMSGSTVRRSWAVTAHSVWEHAACACTRHDIVPLSAYTMPSALINPEPCNHGGFVPSDYQGSQMCLWCFLHFAKKALVMRPTLNTHSSCTPGAHESCILLLMHRARAAC